MFFLNKIPFDLRLNQASKVFKIREINKIFYNVPFLKQFYKPWTFKKCLQLKKIHSFFPILHKHKS